LIIRCEKCATTYRLDQKTIEPFGSKVRCSRCGYIFWVEPPSFLFSEDPELTISPSNPGVIPAFKEEVETASIQLQPDRKILWTLATLAVFILIALTARFFYVRYFHPGWSMADTWSKVFFFTVDPEGNQKLSLINVKKYYKENEKIGQLLIIEGEIKNGYPTFREKVIIRASLKKTGEKVIMSREVYAGWILTSEELRTLSLEEIGRLQTTQPERFSLKARILPGERLPFMILFPPLPAGLTQVSIEVVAIGSRKVQASSSPNLFTG
jgi:predicted Zn finger-like uncharacterized protein